MNFIDIGKQKNALTAQQYKTPFRYYKSTKNISHLQDNYKRIDCTECKTPFRFLFGVVNED